MSSPYHLERITFEVHRAAEYFTIKELQIQTGQSVGHFGDVATKELFDNGIDAAEEAGVVPEVTVELRWRPDGGALLRVRDNGRGLPAETVRRILDFNTRTSSKALYRSPTRGALGNALKCVIGMPTALGCPEPVLITACGVRHTITVRTDPLGRAHVHDAVEDVGPTVGTTVEVVLPADAWSASDPAAVCIEAAVFNPHALVQFSPGGSTASMVAAAPGGNERPRLYKPRVRLGEGWRKWLPTDPTSPHWYDRQAFERLVYGHIAAAQAGGRDLPLGVFVRQFRGLRRTQTARNVCAALPGVGHLSDLDGRPELIALLRDSMCRAAGAPPKPEVLGLVGRDCLRARLADPRTEGDAGHFWYEKATWLGLCNMPWAAEVAIAARRDWDPQNDESCQWYGLNFSPCLGDPLAGVYLLPAQEYVDEASMGLENLLDDLHVVGRHAPHLTMTAVHVVAPALEHRDRGKSRLHVDAQSAARIATMVARAARELYKEGEKRRTRFYGGTVRESRPPKQDTMHFKEAFPQVIEDAYVEARGSLTTVEARTVAYAVRPRLQVLCPGREMGRDFMQYITQTLIPDYQREHPGALPGIVYEPRGRLIEPHTRHEVRLGTREVAAYIIPPHRYNKILIVEKKGRTLVLLEARLAEKYDMAIADTEGYATTAARELLLRCSQDEHYQIFVLHDADWHGYTIARALREETRRMPGYSVDVIDIGLFYEEAVRPVAEGGYGLQTELRDRVIELPAGLALSPAERAAFTGVPSNPPRYKNKKRVYVATCVEINAFPNDALVAYIEEQLERRGAVGKVLPPADVLLAHYEKVWTEARRAEIEERILAQAEERIERELDTLRAGAGFDDPALSERLAEDVQAAFEEDCYIDWRGALEKKAEQQPDPEEQAGASDTDVGTGWRR